VTGHLPRASSTPKLLWRISAPLVEVMVHSYTVRVWIIRLMITVWGSGLKVRLLL